MDNTITHCFYFLLFFCLNLSVFAQPQNNECSGASSIVGLSGAPLQYGPYSNIDATSEASDPADPGFPDASIDNTTWYTLMGDGNTYFIYTSANCGVFTIEDDTYITDGDTQIAVYTGECDDLELLTLNDDNIHIPEYDVDGNFPAGVILTTELGVDYSIMIDGYSGAAGEFCIVVTDWICTANIELAEGQETSIELCIGEAADIGVNDATLDFGLVDIGLGLNYGVAWIMTSEDPMGEHPRFVDSYLGFVGTDFTFAGSEDGGDPFFGLDCIWLTPITTAEVTGSGSAYLSFDCQAVGSESIEICFIASGEGNCEDPCGEANIDLAEGTPLVIDLCLDEQVTINYNEETINYGELAGENPTVIWIINTFDPEGNPFGTSGGILSFPSTLVNDGIADTLWITFTLVENLNEDGGIDWICRPISETVCVIFYGDDDPACDVGACGIGEGNAGEITVAGETTVCVGDGLPDVVEFSTSAKLTEDASYGYLITNNEFSILSSGIVEGSTFSQDFDDTEAGVCLVWGVLWEGDIAGAFIQGGNAVDIFDALPDDACIDITDAIEITRENCPGTSCLTADSLELVKLYQATDGENWTNNSGWLTAPVNEWFGVTLSEDGCNVERLEMFTQLNADDFIGNNLVGNIPDLNLSELIVLDLRMNELSGEIPNFSNLPNLNFCSIWGNQFLFSDILNGWEFMTEIDGCEEDQEPCLSYAPQADIPLFQSENTLYVTVGDVENNSYSWYKDGNIMADMPIVGDSTLTITESGTYCVVVTNAILTQANTPEQNLVLNSECNAITITHINNTAINQPILKTSPNPSNTFVDIQLPASLSSPILSYRILGLDGRTWEKHPFTSNGSQTTFRMNWSTAIPDGIYILYFQLEDGSYLRSEKLIKIR